MAGKRGAEKPRTEWKSGAAGAIGKGGVNPAPGARNHTVRVAAEQLVMVPLDDLVPYANNARIHDKKQIAQLRASLREFGFVTPLLIDFDNNIIAGHGRLEAAQAEGLTEVPCVLVSNLTEAQRKAYILADNRLSETAAWDTEMLKIEMEGLQALDFDVGITGFEMEDLDKIEVSAYTRAAPGKSAADSTDPEDAGNEDYQAFVDKFKPKKTTDDCYTPEPVYDAVADWVSAEYGVDRSKFVRPFWPGGDYQSESYPDGCVVVDNPPFSVLAEIQRWYSERGIRFFLFAPTLTLFGSFVKGVTYIPVAAAITYENGAVVNTSFLTNLDRCRARTAPDLYHAVKIADDSIRAQESAELPAYVYPDHVVTSAMVSRWSKYGIEWRLEAADCVPIRALDAQREQGKAVFGGGFLLSERAAAERAAATKWDLSEREKEIVRNLGK